MNESSGSSTNPAQSRAPGMKASPRWDAADVSAVRSLEPEFTDDEVMRLLDAYREKNRRNPVSYAINGKTSGHLRRDLERARGGIDPAAAMPTANLELRRMVVMAASQIEPEAVSWLWDGRVPAGHVTLIAGREGIGKSLLACWMAAQVTRGKLDGTLTGTPRNVMYCTTEDSWAHTVSPRMNAAGADLARVYRVDVQTADGAGGYLSAELTLPKDVELLAAKIRELDIALVIIDPLMSAADTSLDTHSDRQTRIVLEPLSRLTAVTGTALVGITHFNKNGQQRDPLNLVTGSRAFTAVARCVMAVARDDASGTGVITQVKNNLGTLDVPSFGYRISQATITNKQGTNIATGKIDFTGNAPRGVWEILSDTETATDRAESTDCATWLRNELEKGPAKSKDLESGAKTAGYSESTLNRARRKLAVKPVKKDDGWWVELPAAGVVPRPESA